MKVEIFGPEPSCVECKASLKNAKKAVKELGLDIEVVKKNVISDEGRKLGIALTPALVIDGKVIKLGSVPSKDAVKAAIERMLKMLEEEIEVVNTRIKELRR
ncbi:MAG: thioredoxin family protein [Methanophagales archaeon]|nr:thioredoxin family protein [Methanophagales archaeon]